MDEGCSKQAQKLHVTVVFTQQTYHLGMVLTYTRNLYIRCGMVLLGMVEKFGSTTLLEILTHAQLGILKQLWKLVSFVQEMFERAVKFSPLRNDVKI